MAILPDALIRSLQGLPGFDAAAFTTVHAQEAPVTSIRLNPQKAFSSQHITSNLPALQAGPQPERIPWSSQGYYLPLRPSFTLDPLFHAGAYYVQEASSMFLEEVVGATLDVKEPLRVLDLCAAPGGKSTLLQSLLSPESILVSNEVIKTRVNILAENISKWGAANVIVTNNDPRDFQRLGAYFDLVVVDAPCSGSGLFRKDPEAINEWSEANVVLCSQRQQRILADVMPALKKGGILIYSTCSYSPEEDEAIGDWLCAEFGMTGLQVPIEAQWGIVETVSEKHKAPGYRFYPDKLKGEGFFIAAFRKTSGDDTVKTPGTKHKTGSDSVSKKELEVLRPFLREPDRYFFIRQQDQLIALPAGREDDLRILQSSLYIRKAGVRMGTVIREELVPEHELAVSTLINATVPGFDVDETTALDYLRREAIRIDTEFKGWALLRFAGLPLGWIKMLGNRINNYYPASWRILNK